jgi:uncharacterized protein
MSDRPENEQGWNYPALSAYGDGGFRIGDERVEGSILIVDGRVEPLVSSDMPATGPLVDRLSKARPTPEFLLFGMGEEMKPVPKSLRDALAGINISIEAMSTPAACRSFALLRTQGRAFAVALIAV